MVSYHTIEANGKHKNEINETDNKEPLELFHECSKQTNFEKPNFGKEKIEKNDVENEDQHLEAKQRTQ